MDEETLNWLLTDRSLDPTSGLPLSTVVFMLYYGMELKHFLLKISDITMKKYPLKIYDVGRSSVYLCGSTAHGFFLNTNKFPEVKDFDIVSIFNQDVRKECKYDKEETGSALYIPSSENEVDRNFCPGDSDLNATCGSDKPYLNIETWHDTYPGFVMLRKCRRHQRSVQTMFDRFVNSTEVMESRFDFWSDTKPYLRQKFDKNWGGDFSSSGPLLSILNRVGPAVNVYLTDSHYAATSMLNTDLVFALPYPGWPEITGDWMNRDRPSGWPNDELKLAVSQSRCEIVPTGHYLSPREEFEWKISFSHGEMLLSRSFTRVQREIVHIMKALISKLPSYFILNIMYHELEQIHEKEWTSQNIARLFFHLVDKYIKCVEKKDLPHYFIPSRNLMVKFLNPTVERMIGEFIPTDDYLDMVLLTLFEIRRDPLNSLLTRKRNLAIPNELHTLVFKPFVESVKLDGTINAMVYVETLIRLSKAHIYEENIEQAYVYAQDALKLFQRVREDTPVTQITDVYLTVAMASYLYGDIDSALKHAAILEPMLERKDGLLGSGSIFNEYRTYYIMLYIRLLMIKSCNPALQESASMEKAEEMFSKLSFSVIPDMFTYLEKINFYLLAGKYNEVDTILETLSFFLLHGFGFSQNYFPLSGTENNENDANSGNGNVPLQSSVLRGTNENIQPSDTTMSDQEGSRSQDPNIEILYERESTQSGTENHHVTSHNSHNLDNVKMESTIVLSNDDKSTDTSNPSTEGVSCLTSEGNNPQGTGPVEGNLQEPGEPEGILYDRQSLVDDETEKYKEDAIKTVDYYLIERCQIAERYDKIGMNVKAEEIRKSVKEKMFQNNPDGNKLFEIVQEYVKTEKKSPYDFVFPVPSYWTNVFHYNLHYIVYTTQDLPILDDILKVVIRKTGKLVKIPHRAAFMHFLIQRHKMKGDIEKAKEILNKFEMMVEDLTGECQLLVGYHFSYFGDTKSAVKAFKRVIPEDPVQKVQEELINRINQLIDIVSRYEIRNEGLNKIFDL